jgi:pentatricopeptide repeat protein
VSCLVVFVEPGNNKPVRLYKRNNMFFSQLRAPSPLLLLSLCGCFSSSSFSAAITACEKVGDWRTALELLDSMEKEGVARTPISYNAAISACEKGMVPQKACEVFQRMKREGIRPSVVSYSALISATEKGSQWKLALEILEDMKADGFRGNVIAYSAAISALAKGQQWEKALDLFREIQACGKQPSIVTVRILLFSSTFVSQLGLLETRSNLVLRM